MRTRKKCDIETRKRIWQTLKVHDLASWIQQKLCPQHKSRRGVWRRARSTWQTSEDVSGINMEMTSQVQDEEYKGKKTLEDVVRFLLPSLPPAPVPPSC